MAFVTVSRVIEAVLNGSIALGDGMDLNWQADGCWTSIILSETASASDLSCDHFIPRLYRLATSRWDTDRSQEKGPKAQMVSFPCRLGDRAEYQKQLQ